MGKNERLIASIKFCLVISCNIQEPVFETVSARQRPFPNERWIRFVLLVDVLQDSESISWMLLEDFVGYQDCGAVTEDLNGFKGSVAFEGSLIRTQLVDIMTSHQMLAKVRNFIKGYKGWVRLLIVSVLFPRNALEERSTYNYGPAVIHAEELPRAWCLQLKYSRINVAEICGPHFSLRRFG